MKLLAVLILISAAALINAGDETSKCKLAPDFGAVGNQTIGPLPKGAKFCKNLNKTCCSPQDFETMWSIWEDPTNKESLRKERTTQMITMINVVNYLKVADDNLITISNIIKKAQIDADPACGVPAYIQRKLFEIKVTDTAVNQFRNTGKRCWKYTKNLMNGLMCAACDADAQDYIDYQKKELFITNEMCDVFLVECGEHLKSIQAIYFYFDVFTRLTYCDLDGKFAIQEVPVLVNFPKQVSEAINGCINNKRRDDCTVVCQSQLGFTTMTTFEFLNRNRLAEAKTKITAYLTDMTAKANKRAKESVEQEKKQKIFARRVLEKSKSINETMERLNAYKIKLSPKGLNFTHYIKDDIDGYKDIDEKEVFGITAILAAISIWTLSLFVLIN